MSVVLIVEGAMKLIRLLREGFKAVSPQEAQSRALVCAECPWHMPTNNPIRKSGKHLGGIVLRRHVPAGLREQAPKTLDIHTCGLCGCWLGVKVWLGRDDLETPQRIHDAKPPHCWL